MWKPYATKESISISCFYTMFTRHRNAKYVFRGETHNFWECLYIVNGKLKVISDEKTYLLDGGNLVFHKPLELHKYDVISENGADILVFSFDMESEFGDFFKERVIELNLHQKDIITEIINCIEDARSNSPSVEKHTIELLHESGVSMQLLTEYIKILFLSIYQNNKNVDIFINKDADLFKKAVEYMKNNLNDNLSVQDLSEIFYVSESTVKRIFRRNSGMGVHAYFMKMKILESVRLLRQGLQISEIALMLGYKDASYFSTVFKRETGLSPTHYQKKYR